MEKANRFGCEAIVLGAHNSRLLKRFFPGGTAKKVLKQTQKPVFLVSLKNVKTGAVEDKNIDGVFIFIGHTPNTQLFEGQLEMEDGYIVTNKNMETNIPGVYAAGEAADPVFRQVITSAGMGAAAAIRANRYLEEHEAESAPA